MRITLSPRTVSFSFRSTNAMQSILPLFKLGSNTWQNFASKFFLVTKGRVSLARGRKRADRCLLAFTNWQFESVRKLPYEGAPSTKKIRRALEDPLRENSKSRREACSNDWWAFKGVSLDSLSVLSRGRKIYELVCARMRTKMHDRNHVNAFSRTNDRATHSGSLHRERETTNPASLYSASRGNDFLTENYSIKLGNNSVKRMNYYCPWIVKIIIMVIELCRVKWNQIQYRI